MLNSSDFKLIGTLKSFLAEDIESITNVQKFADKANGELYGLSMALYHLRQYEYYLGELLSTHEIKKPEQLALPRSTENQNQYTGQGKSYGPTFIKPNDITTYKPYDGQLKSDDVKGVLYEILNDISDEEIDSPGFIGRLVAETQSKLHFDKSKKSDPKYVLDIVVDVLNTRKISLAVINDVNEALAQDE